jgi:hypothetical protein
MSVYTRGLYLRTVQLLYSVGGLTWITSNLAMKTIFLNKITTNLFRVSR